MNSTCQVPSPTNTISIQTVPSSPEQALGTVPENDIPFRAIKQEPCDQIVPDMVPQFPFYNYQMYPDSNMHFYSSNDQYHTPSYDQQYQQYVQMNYYCQAPYFQPSYNHFH